MLTPNRITDGMIERETWDVGRIFKHKPKNVKVDYQVYNDIHVLYIEIEFQKVLAIKFDWYDLTRSLDDFTETFIVPAFEAYFDSLNTYDDAGQII